MSWTSKRAATWPDPVRPVHRHDIGRVRGCGSHRFLACTRLGYDLDAAGRLEHGFEASPHQWLVVGDDNPQLAYGATSL